MEALFIVAAGGLILYNAVNSEPQPQAKPDPGTALPPPRFLYSDPSIWTAAPVDIQRRANQRFWGPNNDPRLRYLLPGGVRVVHSGYNPTFTSTNLDWPNGGAASSKPSSVVPMYKPMPTTGIGEPQVVSSKTVI